MYATIYYLDRPIAAQEAVAYLSDEFFFSSPIVQIQVEYPAGEVPPRDDLESIERYANQFANCFSDAGLVQFGEKSMVLTEEGWSAQLEVSVVSAIESITGVMPWIVRVYYHLDGSYKETLVLDSAIYDRSRN